MVEVVATPLEEEVVTMVELVTGTLMVALLALTSPKVMEGRVRGNMCRLIKLLSPTGENAELHRLNTAS